MLQFIPAYIFIIAFYPPNNESAYKIVIIEIKQY